MRYSLVNRCWNELSDFSKRTEDGSTTFDEAEETLALSRSHIEQMQDD